MTSPQTSPLVLPMPTPLHAAACHGSAACYQAGLHAGVLVTVFSALFSLAVAAWLLLTFYGGRWWWREYRRTTREIERFHALARQREREAQLLPVDVDWDAVARGEGVDRVNSEEVTRD